LVGGSIPEREGDKLFNTALAYGPQGQLLAKHRKMHLFDIDVPGKIKFQESATLTLETKSRALTQSLDALGWPFATTCGFRCLPS